MSVTIQCYLIKFAERSDQRRQGLIDLLHGPGRQVSVDHYSGGEREGVTGKISELLRGTILIDPKIGLGQARNHASGVILYDYWDLYKINDFGNGPELLQVCAEIRVLWLQSRRRRRGSHCGR